MGHIKMFLWDANKWIKNIPIWNCATVIGSKQLLPGTQSYNFNGKYRKIAIQIPYGFTQVLGILPIGCVKIKQYRYFLLGHRVIFFNKQMDP